MNGRPTKANQAVKEKSNRKKSNSIKRNDYETHIQIFNVGCGCITHTCM